MNRYLIILVCLSILCGCAPSKNLNDISKENNVMIYDGNDGEQTYNKAVEFFNNNVSYYKEYINKNDTEIINTYYKEDNMINVSELNIYGYQDMYSLSYSCYKDELLHVLYLGEDDLYEYDVFNDTYLDRDEMYLDITKQEGYRLLSIDRIDLSNEVKLILKIEDSHTYNMGEDYTYILKEVFINKDGYIIKEIVSYYSDIQCNYELDHKETIYYKLINSPNQTINEELSVLRNCNGKTYEEIIEMIKE